MGLYLNRYIFCVLFLYFSHTSIFIFLGYINHRKTGYIIDLSDFSHLHNYEEKIYEKYLNNTQKIYLFKYNPIKMVLNYLDC